MLVPFLILPHIFHFLFLYVILYYFIWIKKYSFIYFVFKIYNTDNKLSLDIHIIWKHLLIALDIFERSLSFITVHDILGIEKLINDEQR